MPRPAVPDEFVSDVFLPFRLPGLAVLAGIAAVATLPYGRLVAWPLATLWSLLLIRATLAHRTEVSPIPLARETADLQALGARALAALAFVFLPYGLMVAARYVELAFPDSGAARNAANVVIGLGAVVTFVNVWYFPAVLSFAATELDLLFFLSPRRVSVRMSKLMWALAAGFPGVFAVVLLGGALDGLLPVPLRPFPGRFAGFALLLLVARLIGLQLLPERERP